MLIILQKLPSEAFKMKKWRIAEKCKEPRNYLKSKNEKMRTDRGKGWNINEWRN